MSTTSQKHQDFVAEPMGEKEVTAIAGVGAVAAKKLSAKGYDKAYVLLGQFLLLKKDEEIFKDWLKETSGLNARYTDSTYNCLKEWCNSYI
jgi:hypothetical protein